MASKPQKNPKGKLIYDTVNICISIGSLLDLYEFIELQNYYKKLEKITQICCQI